MCDKKALKKQIKRLNKNIRVADRKITKLEYKKGRYVFGLDNVKQKLDNVTKSIDNKKNEAISAVSTDLNNKLDNINKQFEQKIRLLEDRCSSRNNTYNVAKTALNDKILINQNLRTQLIALLNSTTDLIEKQRYQREITAYDRLLKDMIEQRDKGDKIHAERMTGCSPTDKNSVYAQKERAIADVNKQANNSLVLISVKYDGIESGSRKPVLTEKKNVMENNRNPKIDMIESQIQQIKSEKASYELQKAQAQETLNNC